MKSFGFVVSFTLLVTATLSQFAWAGDLDQFKWGDFDNGYKWPARCHVQYMYDNHTGIWPTDERRVCSFGVTFGNDVGNKIKKTFACIIEEGTSCSMMLKASDLGLHDKWYPQDVWTERDMTSNEQAKGCVYMQPYPTAHPFVFQTLVPGGFKSILEVKVVKRFSCALGGVPGIAQH